MNVLAWAWKTDREGGKRRKALRCENLLLTLRARRSEILKIFQTRLPIIWSWNYVTWTTLMQMTTNLGLSMILRSVIPWNQSHQMIGYAAYALRDASKTLPRIPLSICRVTSHLTGQISRYMYIQYPKICLGSFPTQHSPLSLSIAIYLSIYLSHL